MPQKITKLTKEQETFIKENYQNYSVKELAAMFGLSNKCMRAKIERLGIKLAPLNRNKKVVWEEWQIDFLKENYVNMEYKEIAKYFGGNFTEGTILRKIQALKLPSKNSIMGHRIKTDSYGYKFYNVGKKRIFLHRENAEKMIGRKLTSADKVHHIDCNKSNEDCSNLYVCSLQKHKKLHFQLEQIARQLYEIGYIVFDRENGEYLLNLPTRTEGCTKCSQGQRIGSEKI